MKILILIAAAALIGACAPHQHTTTTTQTTARETTSSRVGADTSNTRTYTKRDLDATGESDVARALEKREPAITARRR